MNELIECLRCKLIDVAEERGSLTHPEVVAASVQLDNYIVKVQQSLRGQSNQTDAYGEQSWGREGYRVDWLTDFIDWHGGNLRQTAPPL